MEPKMMAALETVQLVEDGQVIGLGTGSTTHYFIRKLGDRVKQEELEILTIPTSYQSFYTARESGLPLTTLEEHDVDLAVDGADEVDPYFNLIKGGGAAHTQEKLVDSAADRFIVIVDESKLVDQLGTFPVPVEIIPQGCRMVIEGLRSLGGSAQLRMGKCKDGPVITDNGNLILDVDFGLIDDPAELELDINNLPGVIENGLFVDVVDMVIVGTESQAYKLKRRI